MTDRDKALRDARLMLSPEITGTFGTYPNEMVEGVCAALLQEAERCERLELCRRLLDEVRYGIDAQLSGDSEEGPEHWKVSRADFPKLFGNMQAGNMVMPMGVAIVEALELAALKEPTNGE